MSHHRLQSTTWQFYQKENAQSKNTLYWERKLKEN